MSANLPVERTELRFSVQVIDDRRVPMAIMQSDNKAEALAAFDEYCGKFYWQHAMFCDGEQDQGKQVIINRPRQRPPRGRQN